VKHFLRVLAPNGKLVVELDKSGAGNLNFKRTLVFAGLLDVEQSESGENLVFTAKKSSWTSNSSVASISIKKKAAAPVATKAPVWNLSGKDLNEDDLELEDEDALLENEQFSVVKKPVAVAADCGPAAKTTKKACKNCSCGRAEEEAAAEAAGNAVPVAAPAKSACGSCYLGDAFRCSSCPFLGQPAFQPGDKVKLEL
jgi:hypothetical protein